MEQSVASDSTLVSEGHDTTRLGNSDAGREAAITRMLTDVAQPERWVPGASPPLTAMVAEWAALARTMNGGGVTDEAAEALDERLTELQIAICDFPAASVADLLAKVPVFRDELQDAVGGLDPDVEPEGVLSGAAWLGLFRDFERLAAAALAERREPAGDDLSMPGFVLYEDTAGATRRKPVADWIAYMAQRLYHVARNEAIRQSCAAESDAPGHDANALHDRSRRDLRLDALHDLAFRSRDIFETSRDYGVGDRWRHGAGAVAVAPLSDADDARYQAAFHGALNSHRVAHRAFNDLVDAADVIAVAQANGDTSEAIMAPLAAARDDAGQVAHQAWRDLFAVRPRTWHHLSLLLEHVAEHFDGHQGIEDEPDVFGALRGAGDGLRLASEELTATHDLSLLSINQLEDLANACRDQARVLGAFEVRGIASGTPLGAIYDLESNRLGILCDHATAEIARWRPTDEWDRNLRLEAMIKADLAGNGYVEPALLAEAVAAWGTR